MTATSATERL